MPETDTLRTKLTALAETWEQFTPILGGDHANGFKAGVAAAAEELRAVLDATVELDKPEVPEAPEVPEVAPGEDRAAFYRDPSGDVWRNNPDNGKWILMHSRFVGPSHGLTWSELNTLWGPLAKMQYAPGYPNTRS